jgi:hypothetical protein
MTFFHPHLSISAQRLFYTPLTDFLTWNIHNPL